MLGADFCDYSDAYFLCKEVLLLKVMLMLIIAKKILHLKKMHHLSTAFQKLTVCKLIMQKA